MLLQPIIPLVVFVACLQTVQAGAADFNRAKWDKNVPIPYIIDNGFDQEKRNTIREALDSFEANTCLRFKEDSTPVAKLEYRLTPNENCRGEVGKYEDENTVLYLRESCIHLTALQHETMHTIGFHHTQSRDDRDNYVKVPAELDNDNVDFKKLIRNEKTTDYGIPYEYDSMLHYPFRNGFEPLDRDYFTATPHRRMTFNDWKLINMHYKCNEACPPETACQNGGYQHPNDCTKCVCPQFYAGTHCDEGLNILSVTPEQISSLNYNWEDQKELVDGFYQSPSRLVKSSEGTRIRITIELIQEPFESTPEMVCNQYGVEIADGDLTRVGKRFCSTSRNGYSFVSATNTVGYRAYSLPERMFVVNVTFAVDGSQQSPQPVQTDSPTSNNEQTEESKPLPAQIDEGSGAPVETPPAPDTVESPTKEISPETESESSPESSSDHQTAE